MSLERTTLNPVVPPTDGAVLPQRRWEDVGLPLMGGTAALATGVAVGFGGALWVLLAVGAVAAVLFTYYSERGILHAIALAPFIEGLDLGPASIGRLMAVGIVVVLGFRLLSGRLSLPDWRPIVWLPGVALFLGIFTSGLWARSMGEWAFEVGSMALALAYFAGFALLVTRVQHVHRLLVTYVLGATFASFVGLAQVFTPDARAVGLQGDANIFALYQVAAIPAAIALAKLAGGARRVGWTLTMLPIVASIVASESRGALIALVVTALYQAGTHRRRWLLLPLTAAAMTGGVLAVVLSNYRYSPERVAADRASGRIDIWLVAWRSFLDHPWFGIGSGSFKTQSIELLTTEPGVELVKSHLLFGEGISVHNIYLEAAAETGVFGLSLLVLFLALTGWNLYQAARRHRSAAVAALLPMLVAFCVAAFFLSIPNSKLLWMLAGLAAALSAIPRAADGESPTADPALESAAPSS